MQEGVEAFLSEIIFKRFLFGYVSRNTARRDDLKTISKAERKIREEHSSLKLIYIFPAKHSTASFCFSVQTCLLQCWLKTHEEDEGLL